MDTASILKSWRTLNAFLKNATKNQCEELLRAEIDGNGRGRFARRIHGRLSVTRSEEELRYIEEHTK